MLYNVHSHNYCSKFLHDTAESPANEICITGDVRLVDGYNSGAVEICYNNQWEGVCNEHWDNDNAKVVCRQLGFPDIGIVI